MTDNEKNHATGERAELITQLAAARTALTETVRDLTDEQAGLRPTASSLCLGGLVKHVASMEESWQNFAVEGPSAMRFTLPEGVEWSDIMAGTAREFPKWMIDHQNEFQMQPGDTVAAILDRFERVAARTEEIITSLPDLSVTYPLPEAPWNTPGTTYSARRAFLHLIAEISQHAGHAEILRESIDGKTSF